jgi:hypothetical protein
VFTPLTAGAQYQLDVMLHQAWRADLNHPGGYDLFLATANTISAVQNATLLGTLNPTSSFDDGWVQRSLTFTAPADSASRLFLFFSPYGLTSSAFLGDPVTYPGLDAANLALAPTSVPEPGSLAMWSLTAVAGAAWTSRRYRRSPRGSL